MYDPVKQQVFISQNVRFAGPSVGEDIERVQKNSEIPNNTYEPSEVLDFYGEELEMDVVSDEEEEKEYEKLLERAEEKLPSFLDDTLDETQFNTPPPRLKTPGTYPESPEMSPLRPITPPPRPLSAPVTPQTVQRNLFPLAPRKSGRVIKLIDRWDPSTSVAFTEPTTYVEAVSGEDKEE